MSDQNLVWSDIIANEIIRTRLNVWHWSGNLSGHLRKVIIPTANVHFQIALATWGSVFAMYYLVRRVKRSGKKAVTDTPKA